MIINKRRFLHIKQESAFGLMPQNYKFPSDACVHLWRLRRWWWWWQCYQFSAVCVNNLRLYSL